MRRRLFWTIAGVAAITGLLVLAGSVVASQRAAVDATYREMKQSSDEAVAIINDALVGSEQRPAAILEVLRLLEGEQLGPLFARIRRTAGGSEIAFAVLARDGSLRTNANLFGRVVIDTAEIDAGLTDFTRSDTDELVVVTPTTVEVRDVEVTLLVALARDAPIVRLGDQVRGLLLLVIGIAALAALLARFLSSQITDRLQPLAEASRSVATGNMTARVPDLRDPELDAVASAFNEMAARLEATRAREREFIIGVGHDLRTPLTTIAGYAEALEAGHLDDAEMERIGGVLGVQSRQLGRLIEDLSILARLEQPEFSLRRERMDVGAHVMEVLEGFRRRAAELGVALVVEAEEGVMLEADPDRVGQIAQNLVENALRHTPETGSVRVEVSGGDEEVTIAVSDTGSGIAPEDVEHVFERYFVGQQRSVRKEGSGLGLSIVKGLVDRMGGSVEARSTLGKGTTIAVRLPG
ncbi:MAG TPA: HAMP domain-containing sensor histidine kinase [Acidimicrobiia bacterium]